jgi:diguanylate cyclase (GGDEF)-like protein
MVSADQRVEFRINEDLAARARDGLWGHPICLGLVLVTTTFVRDYPVLMVSFIGLFGLLSLGRIQLLRRLSHTQTWRRTIVLVLMVSGALWGLLTGWACYVYGFHHPNMYQLMLYHAVVSVLGAPTLIQNLQLTRWYIVLVLSPAMLVHLFFPDIDPWGPLCALGSFAIYLSVRARKMCTVYHERLAEHIDLSAIASTDPLTGLSNRLAMRTRLALEVELARGAGKRLALLFIDLDGFKAINDRYSHRVGDLLLCDIAGRLALCGGPTGHVARLGGDEFTILVSDAKLADDIARDLLVAVRQSIMIEGHKCLVTASVGVSVFPVDADTDEDLIRAADHAMYEAKRTGSNQVCFAGIRRGVHAVNLELNSPSPLTSVSLMSRP